MKSTFLPSTILRALLIGSLALATLPIVVSAQAGSTTPANGLPAAPSSSAAAASSSPTTPAAIPTGPGSKIGTINIEQAVLGCNEGQRDMEALRKKLEPKQNELKSQNDELESLQKQLQTQGDKLNEDARATLVKQIETKKKSFDREVQDAQEDAQNQQKDMFQRILQKMAPVIVKHAQDNGYAMIVDTSNPWPQSPILWYGDTGDITRAVVDAYNVQSGVPAPTPQGASTKPASTPKAPATKPATPPASQQQQPK
jgi:outer membrane protein